MANEADSVVENLIGGKRLMSAFVGQDPQSSAEKTLHESVRSPETRSGCHGRHILGCDETVGKIEDSGQREDVSRNIA